MTRYYRKMAEGEVSSWDNPESIELDHYKKVSHNRWLVMERFYYEMSNLRDIRFFMGLAQDIDLDFPEFSKERRDYSLNVLLIPKIRKSIQKHREYLENELEKLEQISKDVDNIK